MERHTLRALASVGLLVILAWIGIVLAERLHGGALIALIVVWAVVVLALLAVALWSIARARRARLERRPEQTHRS